MIQPSSHTLGVVSHPCQAQLESTEHERKLLAPTHSEACDRDHRAGQGRSEELPDLETLNCWSICLSETEMCANVRYYQN
jgi:hypothetical protein